MKTEDYIRPPLHILFERPLTEEEMVTWPGLNPNTMGLSPNQYSMALAEAALRAARHGTAYGHGPDVWISLMIGYLKGQSIVGHCTRGKYTEQGSSIYVHYFWMESWAALVRVSVLLRDLTLYRFVVRALAFELYLCRLGRLTNSGLVFLPGTRTSDCHDLRRDANTYMLEDTRSLSETPKWVKEQIQIERDLPLVGDNSRRYWRGVLMLHDVIVSGELVVPVQPLQPRLLNKMVVTSDGVRKRLFCPELNGCYGGPWWGVEIAGVGEKVGRIWDSSWLDSGKTWDKAKRMGGGKSIVPEPEDGPSGWVKVLSNATPIPTPTEVQLPEKEVGAGEDSPLSDRDKLYNLPMAVVRDVIPWEGGRGSVLEKLLVKLVVDQAYEMSERGNDRLLKRLKATALI